MFLNEDLKDMTSEPWFFGMIEAQADATPANGKFWVLSKPKSMAAHLRKCKHSSVVEKKATKVYFDLQVAAGKRKERGSGDDSGDEGDTESGSDAQVSRPKKKKSTLAVMNAMKQSELKLPKGLDIPIADVDAVQRQLLRATISANLPFRWIEDPEIIRLLVILRTKIVDGKDVLLSTDGWKSILKNAVTAVHLSGRFADGQTTKLTEVCRTNANKKDGQLSLADYYKENTEAMELMEELIDFVNWVNSHDKVREIIDGVQKELTGKVLVYLVANLTRWTTHHTASARVDELKEPIRAAVYNKHTQLIAAQVGAATGRAAAELREAAEHQLDTVEPNSWWQKLDRMLDDTRHICYTINISQSDTVRLDQFLLAFAGMYRHFASHSKPNVRTGMKKRLEKHWRDMDQTPFVVCLILNPFEGVEHFGDKAEITNLGLNTLVRDLYIRIHSCPQSKEPLSEEEQASFEEKVEQQASEASVAFLHFMSRTGPFTDWDNERNQTSYIKAHGEVPIAFWESYVKVAKVQELALFAILLLEIVVNQAGLERTFSDFLIKKNKLRNRLGLTKMAKMTIIHNDIRITQLKEGTREKRAGRQNHSQEDLAELIQVPRYAAAVEGATGEIEDKDEDDGKPCSVLVNSSAAWCRVLAAWRESEQDFEGENTSEEDLEQGDIVSRMLVSQPRAGRGRWHQIGGLLPATLEKLFGGNVQRPVAVPQQRRQALDPEACRMELLAAEFSDEAPDDGALEGSCYACARPIDQPSDRINSRFILILRPDPSGQSSGRIDRRMPPDQ
ncbi:hypothetical protein GGU10DRAFT_417050 [Lentinula aff. detonsa]|uniref:HAT C-terminal dimerisation domain-containing protein n=1 Tax=Lentinula aff. detonsa TaxID=2804958 RepID=A0AA38NJ72_9AGAR|nr:hypothetical protein GGU10DRAFT_417050 [Lentinula aff. detonsa]